MSTATLKNVRTSLERMLCCDELARDVQEHISFALAHINEAGKEAEEQREEEEERPPPTKRCCSTASCWRPAAASAWRG